MLSALGGSIWIKPTGSPRSICHSALHPEESVPPGLAGILLPGEAPLPVLGAPAHSISPSQVGMEMDRGAHRHDRWELRTVLPPPSPTFLGVSLLSVVPKDLKQMSKGVCHPANEMTRKGLPDNG